MAAAWLLAAGPAAAQAVDPSSYATGRQVLVMLRLPAPHLQPRSGYAGGYGDAAGRAARRRIALRLAREHGLALVDDWPMPMLGVDCFILQAPAGRSVADEARALSRDPAVEWAEPSSLYHAQSALKEAARAEDPLYRTQPAASAWRLEALHQIATGRNVRVAVIDSRIQQDHPDLSGQVQTSRNFVPDRSLAAEVHGTGVAGVIAAKAHNGLGIEGVAPDARLLALRACWQTAAGPGAPAATLCDSVSLAKALSFAIDRRAEVINLSLSGPPDPLLGKLIDLARDRGATVVAAFDPKAPSGGFPASHAGVVAVTDETLAAPPAGVYSAPGRDIPTTQPGGRWFLVSGSSYAAAHVSGLFALMRERDAHARSGRMLAVSASGGGRIDACASLLRTAGPCDCACARSAAPSKAR
jgi:subtilisin family serine protease